MILDLKLICLCHCGTWADLIVHFAAFKNVKFNLIFAIGKGKENDRGADTFVFGIAKYLGNFFSPVSEILNYCLIFVGPNEVLTLKVFLEVKWCI